MRETKNDLSYDKAELDYQALIQTARIAQGHCIRDIQRCLSRFYDTTPAMHSYHEAETLKREAHQLVIVAETLHTLEEGLRRSQIEIVNKPTE